MVQLLVLLQTVWLWTNQIYILCLEVNDFSVAISNVFKP